MANKMCIHCGDDCGIHPIEWEGKPFCCNGCKTVFQILAQSNLDKYYSIENSPGVKSTGDAKFDFLDNDEIARSLLLFDEGGFKRVKFYIPSIHCSSCLWLLENLPKLHVGIVSSSVHFTKKEVTINFKSEILSLRQVAELLASISYVPLITLQTGSVSDENPGRNTSKRIQYQLGIAAFCFGNIMLLSLPDYMPGSEFLDQSFRQFFGYINLLLVLPVFFYSGIDYIITAYKTVMKRRITIDLPVALGMVTLFLQTILDVVVYDQVGYSDSLSGLVFFLLIGKWYQSKTYEALAFDRDYRYYFPIAVSVQLADGSEQSKPIDKIVTGDVIIVRNGELVPADSLLISGNASIDYSFVTGEAVPVSKNKGDFIYAGGKQKGASVLLQVQKPVKQSYLTQLWNETYNDTKGKSSLVKLVDSISSYFTAIIMAIATASFLFWFRTDWHTAMFAFTSVLIVACPCALALSIPFTFGSAMRVLGKFGFYLKKAEVLEVLHNVDAAVFDKTGTITYSGDANVEYHGVDLTTDQLEMVKSVVKHSSHPLSRALYINMPELTDLPVDSFAEITGMGIEAKVNSSELRIGNASFCGSEEQNPQTSSQIHIVVDRQYKGYFSMKNRYRADLAGTLAELARRAQLHVVSGDNDSEYSELNNLLQGSATLHFNQSPTDKLAYVRKLKSEQKTVMMVGDGLNDSGALQESNIGISIAEDVYSFTPASDVILDAKRFSSLPNIMVFSDKCVRVVKISFAISFIYNIVGLSFAVQGILSPIVAAILMPISSVSVVIFATLATKYYARNIIQ